MALYSYYFLAQQEAFLMSTPTSYTSPAGAFHTLRLHSRSVPLHLVDEHTTAQLEEDASDALGVALCHGITSADTPDDIKPI